MCDVEKTMKKYRSAIQEEWFSVMRIKYNTDDEGVRKIMRERQKQSMASTKRQDKPHRGGFNDPQVARTAGEKGRRVRWSQD